MLGRISGAPQLLHALEVEGLLHANQRLGLPLVPLRIGVVTSPGSEAHRDFVGQLDRSGFAFEVFFEPTLVQGAEAPEQSRPRRAARAGADRPRRRRARRRSPR